MGSRLYETIVLAAAIGFIVFALIYDDWRCGQLFKSCMDRRKEVSLATIILFCVGLACLGLALLLDIIQCCSGWLDSNVGYFSTRLLFLLLGSVSVTIALILYTLEIDPNWSYLAGASGAAFATQAALLALITCQCCGVGHSHVVVS